MGKAARDFVDFFVDAKQSWWQVLPVGPTSYGDSPYQSFSTFAGNPYFISLEELIEEGVLTKAECDAVNFGTEPAYVDYGKMFEGRYKLLQTAFDRTEGLEEDEEFQSFCREQAFWLEDYALYMAIKTECFDNKAWTEWAEDIRRRWDYSLDYYKKKLTREIAFWKYLQYKFFQQWNKLKAYANEKGILIIGDIPIYVAMDSADTWANPWLFKLDAEGYPTQVAGCPPDGFSATGQLWGNPLYNWEVHKKSGYEWWIRRVENCFRLYDVLRIDHFRGFDEYYAIPYGDEDATQGWWEKGPGIDLFKTINARLGKREIIAEDLGYMTDTVRQLVKDSTYPNMRVLEFAFDSRDTGNANDYLPHNYERNCVVYTGTHDNETLMGWLKDIKPAEKAKIRTYFHSPRATDDRLRLELIWAALGSVAGLCIIPMQDYLALDNAARMNQPSTLGGNWEWRLLPGQFTKDLQAEMGALAQLYGRCS